MADKDKVIIWPFETYQQTYGKRTPVQTRRDYLGVVPAVGGSL